MLNHSESSARPLRLLCAAVALASTLAACGGDKGAKSGQALASVNGEEITALQLNEELQRSGVSAEQAQQPAVTKQLLENLVDRQLVINEAVKEKVDRDPQVVRAIERAKALLIAQAYMQKKVGAVTKPTPAEVAAYYSEHPVFFAQRKIFDMRQLIINGSDIDDAVKGVIDNAKSLEEVAAYLDAHKVKFSRNQIQRSSSDLPPELSSRLLAMKPGQLFLVKEGSRSVLATVVETKEAPVTLEVATPQIEQYLFGTKNKEAAAAEVQRLRAAAKIEYLNKAAAPASAPAAAP
ncbi:peptidyl-prolyl cis-trans isomerase, EpsD family, partial [Pseudoduganella sp. FT9W]|nr:peptidyl-prolyl cis-trans isomerase, EpsD family [Duganella alba]